MTSKPPVSVRSRAFQHLQPDRLAVSAAAWMLHSGLDHGAAKRRAKAQWQREHPGETAPLPGNEAIDEAIRSHWNTFAPEDAREQLRWMRQQAVAVMQCFAPFEPLLGGACVHEAMTPNSAIELRVFPPDPKSLEIFCANQQLDVRVDAHAHPARHGAGAPWRLDWDGCPVRLWVQHHTGWQRQRQQAGEASAWWTLPQLEAALAQGA